MSCFDSFKDAGAQTRGWVSTRCGGAIYIEDEPDRPALAFRNNKDSVEMDFGDQGKFSFHIRRTVKADDEASNLGLLPGSEGDVPLYVEGSSSKITTNDVTLAAPMYDKQGFYFRFEQDGGIFAVIPVMNGRNVVNGQVQDSGKPMMQGGADQNYLVVENLSSVHASEDSIKASARGLPWLDKGIGADGKVGQLTTSGADAGVASGDPRQSGAMEFIVVPMTKEAYRKFMADQGPQYATRGGGGAVKKSWWR